MSIQTTTIGATNTQTFVSAGQSAVTLMSICNFSSNDQTVSVYIVPNGDTPADQNTFIKDITIVAGDTFLIYEGSEKIILENGDSISAVASNSGSVNAITSYMVI